MRAGERYWGWFEELAGNLGHGAARARRSRPAGIDRYWSDNAPDHPVVMKTLYGLSWRAFHRCTCTGPARGLHPIPVRGRHVTLPLFAARFDRLPLPGDPVRGAAGGDGLPVRAAVRRRGRRRRPAARADAGAAALLLPRADRLLRRARSPPWRSRSASPTGSRCAARAGGSRPGVLFGVALGHQAQRLADAVLPRRPLPVDAAGRLSLRAPRACRACRWRSSSMLVLGPIIFFAALALAVARADRAHARVPQPPPAARALQLRVPGAELEQPADDHRRSSCCARPSRSSRPASRCRSRRWPWRAVGAVVLRAPAPRRPGRPDGAEAEAPVARPRPSWLRPGADVDRAPGAFLRGADRSGRWRCSPCRRRRSSAASSTSCRRCRTWRSLAGDRRSPRSARRAGRRRCRRAARGCGARLPGGAGGAGLPARRRRDAALAPGRPRRTTTSSRADSRAAPRWG